MTTIIAIDGPAGSGKSTLAAALADRLGLLHIDTGAMYRAVTLEALRRSVDTADLEGLVIVAADAVIKVEGKRVWLGEEEVTKEVRSPEVTGAVSAVAGVEGVRAVLVDRQRKLGVNGVVMEGRDIGSVVFPDADLKIYLTAGIAERAERRATEFGDEVGGTLTDLERRDRYDSERAASPLAVPDDAFVIDNSNKGVDEVVDQVLKLLESRDG
jgi:cytidylate kinase